MRVSASDLDQLTWFRRIDDMTLADLVARFRRESPPSEAMDRGIAFHKVMEHPPDEISTISMDGFTFRFTCDDVITLPQVREIKATKDYHIAGVDVTLVGVVDGISGNVVTDHKLTERPDPETYLTSYQWRAYLDIFNADIFTYHLYHAKANGRDVEIKSVDTFSFYRYPEMEADLLAGIAEFVEFAKDHLPERLA
jgi:hypothetical protein